MNKMVINSIEKLFVTADAATILKELDVFHPAAKLAVMAAQRQEEEIGDGTNLVLILAGELLGQSESLLRNGLHTNDVIAGFEKARTKALEILEAQTVWTVTDLSNEADATKAIKTSISSKQRGFADILAPVVARACIQVLSDKNKFNVDNVRVCKILGGGVTDLEVVKGFVMSKGVDGTVKHVKNAKIAILASGLDFSKTEVKDQVLITKASQLENFALDQENQMEKIVKEIAAAGINVIVSGGKIGDIAMHFIEKYGLLAFKANSKFDVQRIARATGGVPIVRLGAPTAEETGTCDEVVVKEIGSTKCTFFRRDKSAKVSTIIVRAATQNILDDLERAIDNGVNTFKQLTIDARFVAGAGAFEVELARQLRVYGEATPGQDQYAIRKFAEALEVIPRTLGENGGHDSTRVVANLYAAHSSNKPLACVDIETGEVGDAVELGVFDLYAGKKNAIYLATDCVISILRIDQIIMAKPAVGPKAPQMGGQDSAD
jgi:T-complex protein 1 subunit theta